MGFAIFELEADAAKEAGFNPYEGLMGFAMEGCLSPTVVVIVSIPMRV